MKFSKIEIEHLVISVLAMGFLVAIHMGLLNAIGKGIVSAMVYLAISLLVTVPAFVFHELGHKIVAQKFGFWAEYRMWTQGLLLAVLIAILSKGSFLFIAPGAVYFAPTSMRLASTEKIGKIGLIGPIINILLSVIFGLFTFLISGGILAGVCTIGATINAFLAIFNLIPVPPFDGQKVFVWDKKIWAITFVLSIILYLTTLGIISG